ncbi:MAG: hypothetical protein AB7K04_16455, partial [Pseudorhodoplanes sp.]
MASGDIGELQPCRQDKIGQAVHLLQMDLPARVAGGCLTLDLNLDRPLTRQKVETGSPRIIDELHIPILPHEMRGDADLVGEGACATSAVHSIAQPPLKRRFGGGWQRHMDAMCGNEEAVKRIVLLAFGQATRVLAIFPRVVEREFQGKALTKMRREKRMGAFLLLERRDSFVLGGAELPADPIDGGCDFRVESVGADALGRPSAGGGVLLP